MATKRKRARIYDFSTRRVGTIPADELAPGMIQMQVSGVKGKVWAAPPANVQPGPYRIKPFDEETRDFLREIKAALDEVRPLSLEEWEDGFRRDMHAEHEVALWCHMSRMYTDLTRNSVFSLEQKREILQLLVACSLSTPDLILTVFDLQRLSRAQAQPVLEAFYGADAPRG
jgi:hypothetical protein